MNLPPFFRRSLQAAHQALGSISETRLLERLADTRVGIFASDDVKLGSSSYLMAEALTNLLARLYPAIDICVRDPEGLVSLAAGINPLVDVQAELPAGPFVSIGTPPADRAEACVAQIGGEGWDVIVGHNAPLSPNAFTATAAACLGAAAIFRSVFGARSAQTPSLDTQVWSLLSHDCESTLPSLQKNTHGQIDCHLLGAGAIGQAFAWTLTKAEVPGLLTVVDHEPIDESNLQRYVLTDSQSPGKVKAGFLADAVVGSLKVNALVGTYEEHADAVENAELIAVALDSAAGRIGAQALLPNRIVNAWTQHSDLGVSSHPSFGEHPCLACLYLPSGAQRSTYQMYADALGEDEVRVMAYAATGIPVGQPLPPEVTMNLPRRMSLPEGADRWLAVPILDDLVERGRLDQADAARFAMARVSDFYREAVCGGVFVRIEGSDEAAEVPLAHQSMLAGVLLAVAATMQAKSPLEARVDLMKHSPRIHKQPRQPTPGCICRDEIYRERFTAKWESSPSLGELGGGS